MFNLAQFLPFMKKKEIPTPGAPTASGGNVTPSLTQKQKDLQNHIETLSRGLVSVSDIVAPSAIEVDFNYLKMSDHYTQTLFVAGYPRYVTPNWLSPLISFNHSLDVAMFIYPQDSKEILDNLRRKVGEMEATIQSDVKRGRVVEPSVQVALEDALSLQQQLAKGAERFFQFGLYITVYAQTVEELSHVSNQIQSTLGSLLIMAKKASLQMEEGFKSTLPFCSDRLLITRNMDTTSLATTFPFTTSELTANEGIMYGLNEHNDSLIIFDRFSLENANSVTLGKSGSGKSFMVKLEILRSLMFDTEVIVIDPEAEYEKLVAATNGEYIAFSFDSIHKINPFDLSQVATEGENELGLKILSLHGLLRVIMGTLTPEEDALLDRALVLTYKQKGITPDPETQKKEPPLMEDLYKVLVGMEDVASKGLADRIEKFVKGSLIGIFNQHSTINIKNPFTVFSIRDLSDELRPIAMYIILDFIWTRVKRDLKKRILIVDEAWYMMKYPDSANFLNSIAKRARKYYLGLSTISQDVEDFLSTELGKTIIQNSSLQILLKQSTAAIEHLAQVFFLSEGEKHLLLSADVGEGLFFAGQAHVAMRVIASEDEHQLATTSPKEKMAENEAKKEAVNNPAPSTLSSQSVPIQQPIVNTEPTLSRPIMTTQVVGAPLVQPLPEQAHQETTPVLTQ